MPPWWRRLRRRTGASGRSCSPRRCGSPGIWISPRSASRTPTRRRYGPGWSAGPAVARGLAHDRRPPPGVDVLRRDATLRRALPLLLLDEQPGAEPEPREDHIPTTIGSVWSSPAATRRSRETSQVALTLRLLCGLTTAEVARAFLVSESTMAARITRAKNKIAAAASPTGCRRRKSCPRGSMRC